ncbi:glycosyltransferase family 4 protein [Patescibacteria group bacterium]|nr:glycosyltransferase family 4 protein [Patescibacteria group bacterium]
MMENLNFAIVKHTFTPSGGAEQELLKYLINKKVKRVVYISHPFSNANPDVPLNTVVSRYEKGEFIEKIKAPLIKGPNFVFYIKDVIFTIYYIYKQKFKFDVYIGVDNLNAFSGLILRKLGLVKKVIFYVIDYVPQRFSNKLLNKVYHWIDKICCYHCDQIWNVSPIMADAREKAGVLKDKSAPQSVVPLGCNFKDIKRLPLDKINRYDIAYMGQLNEEQGIQLMIEALPDIKRKFPDAKLIIIGTGKLEKELKIRAEELKLANSIYFKGFIKDDRKMEEILASCAIGVAPYPPLEHGCKQFCDPGKIKIYMACGLPVIITNVPNVAKDIKEKAAGIVIDYNKIQLIDAVAKLFIDDENYKRSRKNAISFASYFDWNYIFNFALSSSR